MVVFAAAVFVLQAAVAQSAQLAVPLAWELAPVRGVPQAAQPVAQCRIRRSLSRVPGAVLVAHSVVSPADLRSAGRSVCAVIAWRWSLIWSCRRTGHRPRCRLRIAALVAQLVVSQDDPQDALSVPGRFSLPAAFVRSRYRPIRRPFIWRSDDCCRLCIRSRYCCRSRRPIVRLRAWRTIIGSRWPRVRRRLRVRLRYRAINRPVRWLRSIRPVIGRRRRTVRWPVIRLHGVRLRRRPTLSRSIPRLFIIHSRRSVPRIVLRLPTGCGCPDPAARARFATLP